MVEGAFPYFTSKDYILALHQVAFLEEAFQVVAYLMEVEGSMVVKMDYMMEPPLVRPFTISLHVKD